MDRWQNVVPPDWQWLQQVDLFVCAPDCRASVRCRRAPRLSSSRAPGRRQQACMPTFSYASFSSLRVDTHFLQNTSLPSHTNAWRCRAGGAAGRAQGWRCEGAAERTTPEGAGDGPGAVAQWALAAHLSRIHVPPGLWPLLAAHAAARHLLHAVQRDDSAGALPSARRRPPPPLPPPCLKTGTFAPLWPPTGPHRAGDDAQAAAHVGKRPGAGAHTRKASPTGGGGSAAVATGSSGVGSVSSSTDDL